MNSTQIVLFTIIVFIFIIAIFMFVLFRKSFGKQKLHEQKKFEYKDIVNITPDIPPIDEIMKPVTDTSVSKERKEPIPSMDKDLKTHDPELKEILIAEPKIIESLADDNEPHALAEDYSALKLEDTLIDIEDEKKKKRHKKKESKEELTEVEKKK